MPQYQTLQKTRTSATDRWHCASGAELLGMVELKVVEVMLAIAVSMTKLI